MRRMLIALSLVACGQSEPPAEEACPTGQAPVVPGDAQGDGQVNLADAVAVQRAVFDGGPPPACDAAVDLIEDGRIQADDASSLLLYLFEGTAVLPKIGARACDEAVPWTTGACGALSLSWEVTPDGAGSEAVLSVASSLPIEGWSLGIEADGCEVVASEAGTVAADRTEDPVGLRDLGYHATLQRRGALTQAVVLGLVDRVVIPADNAPHPLLRLSLTGSCTLAVVAGEVTYGEPVAAIAVVDGQAVPLPAATAAVGG